jgi:hypothetical protein
MENKIKWAVISLIAAANVIFLVITCQTQKLPPSEETRVTFYVDSVWSKGPGEINTLQVDRIYFGRTTDGEVHTSRSEISVGDSFVYIYRRSR